MTDDMTDDMADDMERPPWWMSGPNASDDPGEQRPGGQAPGLGDMWSLLNMLGNTRDAGGLGALGNLGNLANLANLANLGNLGNLAGEWWEASGASTHTEHDDPSAHPECLICKVLVGLQTVSQQSPGPTQLPPARWLRVRRA